MKNFEKEFKSKMNAMSSQADVIDEIKNNAYKKVSRATPYRVRPLKTVLAAAVTIVLLCSILFIISMNIGTPPLDTPSQNSSGHNALQSGSESSSPATALSDAEVQAVLAEVSRKDNIYVRLYNGILSVDQSATAEKEFSGKNYSYYKVTESFRTVNDIKVFLNTYEVDTIAFADSRYLLEENTYSETYRPPLYTDINGELHMYAEFPARGHGELLWDQAEVQENSTDKLKLKVPFSVMEEIIEYRECTLTKLDGNWLVFDRSSTR